MHVVFVSLGYPPYTFGGVETYVYLLSRELTKNGINVTVITAWPRRNISVEDHDDRLKVVRLPIIDKPIRAIWYQLLNKNYILNLLKDADLVHSNVLQTSLINKEIRNRKPLVVTIHGSPDALAVYFSAPNINVLSVGDLFYFMEFPLVKSFYFKDLLGSDALIFGAHHVYHESLRYLGDKGNTIYSKSAIIPPGIDMEEINLKTADLNNTGNKLEIAYVGRLFWPKGITYAIKAFNIIVNEMGEKKAKLHILGDGPLRGWIMRSVKKYRLGKNIKLYGQVSRDFVMKVLSKVKVVIHPSLYEGCPYVLLEAFALGLPVVTFDLAWSREFIINGINGYRSPPFDTYQLARNMLKARVLKDSSIKSEAKKYDIRLIAKKVVKVYQRLQ